MTEAHLPQFITPTEWTIQKGSCSVLFAYDAARSIKLEEAERRLHEATQRQTIPHKRRAPSYFEYQPPPLRVSQEIEPLNIGGVSARENIDIMVYDFGAVAVTYTLPITGAFSDLLRLAEELYDNEFLLADSRLRVEQFLKVIGDAATQASLAPIVEDYLVFHIESFTRPFDAARFCVDNSRQIAQILRAERQTLSDQEVDDALAAKISFGIEDFTVVDWNAALLIDREGEDVRTVLDFANVELLEMRYLDQRLDRALDQAYDALSRSFLNLPGIFGYHGAALRRVAELTDPDATRIRENIEALRNFVFKSAHLAVLRRRWEWFEKMTEAHTVLWWTPAGQRPTVLEAKERLMYLRQYGSTTHAFTFRDVFAVPDA